MILIFVLLFLLQFTLFIHGLSRPFKQNKDTRVCGAVHLTGMFLLLAYSDLLYFWVDYESSVLALRRANIFFPAVGLTACLILWAVRTLSRPWDNKT